MQVQTRTRREREALRLELADFEAPAPPPLPRNDRGVSFYSANGIPLTEAEAALLERRAQEIEYIQSLMSQAPFA